MDIATIIACEFPIDERNYLTDSCNAMLALHRLRPNFTKRKILGQAVVKSVLAD